MKRNHSNRKNQRILEDPVLTRKRFLQLAGAAVAGMYLPSPFLQNDLVSSPAPARIIINILLEGGPDLRHLFVPPYSADMSTFAGNYWKYRSTAQQIDPNNPSTWQARYSGDYSQVTNTGYGTGTTFGILNRCGWLVNQFNAGNVAIISNVKHSDSRNHDKSLLELQSGLVGTATYGARTHGWGGRLAEATTSQILSMTNQVRPFCNRPDGNRNGIISARDTRNIGLYYDSNLASNPASTVPSAVMTRAMRSYYTQKPPLTGTVYRRFQESELKLRNLGDGIRAILANNPTPASIANLITGSARLNQPNFGQQISSVYDSFLCAAVPDYNFRIMSLNYSGWDTHKRQRETMGNNLEDIFGAGRALDTLTASMSAADRARTVFVISGEFGRQLRSNGDEGTDHGRGNYMMLIGNSVTGGLYGDLFPASDIPNFSVFNRDISGLTNFDQILGRLCDWFSTGIGTTVFPSYTTTSIEAGVDMTNLVV